MKSDLSRFRQGKMSVVEGMVRIMKNIDILSQNFTHLQLKRDWCFELAFTLKRI